MLDNTGNRFIETIQYVDGLGRPTQVNAKKQSGNGVKDIITPTQYDELGRKWKEWIPTAIANDGNEVSNFNSFNNSTDTHPYSEITYGYGALNRVISQTGAGQAWHNASKSVRMEYGFNSSTVSDTQVRYFKVNSNGGLELDGYYPDNALEFVRTYDEDNKILVTFKDFHGRVLLSRQKLALAWSDTYSVYDQMGLLRYVLPPLFSDGGTVTDDLIRKYAYIYTYDSRKRCISKQLPGGVVISYIYDKADRLRMSQDSNQKLKGEWTYYKYDAHGRMVLTGIYKQNVGESISYDMMRARVQSSSHGLTESYSSSGRDLYTFSSYPTEQTKTTTLIANYYDDYSYQSSLPSLFNSCKAYVAGVSDPELSSPMGQQTGSKVALLNDTGSYLWSSIRYGEHGPVQSIEMNSTGGLEKLFYYYSFTGQVIEKRLEHTATNTDSYSSPINEVYKYEYDHADRLKKTYYDHRYAAQPELLSELTYDDLGRLAGRKKYKQSTSGTIDNLTYSYNLRGWLTKIESENFTEELFYEKRPNNSVGFFNGNISAQTSRHSCENSLIRGYKFTYDGLNRLKNATYGEGSLLSSNTNRYSETIVYDKHGNITNHMNDGRASNGTSYGSLQRLKLTYDGNRLKKVTDTGAYSPYYGNQFFHGSASFETEYIYDANGNMVQDFNKGIALVKYNFLNLPEFIQMNNGHSIKYTYDALGRKHKQEIITLKSTVNVNMGEILPVNTDQIKFHRKVHYCGNVIYSGISLLSMRQILTDEGYISYEGYHTHILKDHLGNVRTEIDNFGVQAYKNYYPYGIEYESQTWNSEFAYANKELQSSHGLNWYDFGKRFLDIGLGSWSTMDPLCENHPSISPYTYCGGDPMNRFDPDGLDWYYNTDSRKYVWREGNEADIDELSNQGYINMGLTHVDNGVYYGLLGNTFSFETKEGKVMQKIDEALINYKKASKEAWKDPDAKGETTNFDIGFYTKKSALNLMEGSFFTFNAYGAQIVYFMYPEGLENKARCGGFGYITNEKSRGEGNRGQGSMISGYPVQFERQNTPGKNVQRSAQITFPTLKAAKDFLELYDRVLKGKF